MKRISFNIKDRKVLYMILGITFISIFTLTVAYAALSTVLNISGSAQVSSAEWNVHFDNVKVINGSVSGDDPRITSPTTATFSTVLNMPGDFYEFTIDVVNNGSIDAMIENITKTPTLSSEQAKYLKYDITYQNGESITTKQLVEKNSFVRLKVRLEYRSDITASDLPKTSETLNLGLKLDYIQSDGSGSVVSGNGRVMPVANGSIYEIGTIVTIGSEKFYTIGAEGNNVKLLAMYNLMVGNECTSTYVCTPMESPTGMQSELAVGFNWDYENDVGILPFFGTTSFSNTSVMYSGSIVEGYVNSYKLNLESKFEINVIDARLITYDEITNSSTFGCSFYDNSCFDFYPWIYSTSYWTGSYHNGHDWVWFVKKGGEFDGADYRYNMGYGVRPVIVISKDYFPREVINFTVAGVSYQADGGMTWSEWIDSEYNIDGFEKDFVNNLVVNKDGYNIDSVVLKDVIMMGYNYTISSEMPPA